MKSIQVVKTTLSGIAAAVALTFAIPHSAAAHCDTLDGPVVADARIALDQGDITPTLKWVRAADEQELRESFTKAQSVRKLNPEAKSLAETYFFETLVRIHRAGEGAPFTGLKPAGTVEPVILKADQALEKVPWRNWPRRLSATRKQGSKKNSSMPW